MITITDTDSTTITYDNGFDRPLPISKFTIRMAVDEPLLFLAFLDHGQPAELIIDFNQVSTPAVSSATELKQAIEQMIVSDFWTAANPLFRKGDLLTHDGTTDGVLPVGLDGWLLMADAAAPFGLRWQDTALVSTQPLPHADTHVNGVDDIQIANATQKGLLSASDWQTFSSKQDALGYTPEDVANKSTDTNLGTSNVLYPTQNAVKQYVDSKVTVRRSLADTVTSSTSLTSINQLSVAVLAGQVWHLEASGTVSCSSTSGARLGVLMPAGATLHYQMTAANNAIGTITSNSGTLTTSGEIVQTFAAVGSVNLWWRISGVLIVGAAAGTFAIQGRTVNTINTVTFHTGSKLIMLRE